MKLPNIPYTSSNTSVAQDSFYGLDERVVGKFPYMSDCKNVSFDNFPALSSRKPRGVYNTGENILGVGFADKLFYVTNDGTTSHFYYDGIKVGSFPDTKAEKKFFAVLNRYICIYPDMYYFRRADEDAIRRFEEENQGRHEEIACISTITTSGGAGSGKTLRCGIYLSSNTSEFLKNFKVGDSVFIYRKDENGQMIDAFASSDGSGGIDCNFSYKIADINEDDKIWFEGFYRTPAVKAKQKVYYKLVCDESYFEWFGSFQKALNIKKTFDVDGENGLFRVFISEDNALECFPLIKTFGDLYREGVQLVFKISTSNTFSFRGVCKNIGWGYPSMADRTYYPYIEFEYNGVYVDDIAYSFQKGIVYVDYPELLGACVKDNRIYGFDESNIYVSSLGSPNEFYKYNGTANDSWAVEVVSPGRIVACTYNLGNVLFFKENSVIKLYGNIPSNFQTTEAQIEGVSNPDTLCEVCGALLYVWNGKVMLYTGTYPKEISQNLLCDFSNAKAFASGDKYCLVLDDIVYVYDVTKGLWSKETLDSFGECTGYADAGTYSVVCFGNGDMYIPDAKENYEGFEDEESFGSEAVFCSNYEDTYMHKFVARIFFRVQMQEGSNLLFYIRYDGEGEFSEISRCEGISGTKTVCIPIIPNRCERYEIKVCGKGVWKILSMSRELKAGSTKLNIKNFGGSK